MGLKDEIKNSIQEWMEQAIDVKDVAEIYATIINEADKQLTLMNEQYIRKPEI